ncbi:50S ribosomal protein L36 [Vibrio parahaemolyticus]|nr:50S ribosomal protein L36 [Vibrio parahaemolyticus]EJG0799306.1 50S ribosomal protein L36 [Vibrio parahaemolyticus]MBM5113350.1 50S ribosomal protein L36 [Vibrio parahaemolyticus]
MRQVGGTRWIELPRVRDCLVLKRYKSFVVICKNPQRGQKQN